MELVCSENYLEKMNFTPSSYFSEVIIYMQFGYFYPDHLICTPPLLAKDRYRKIHTASYIYIGVYISHAHHTSQF
jgi:hypothetical protein